MLPKEPSRTARGAAGHRAAHQVMEQGAIFRDPFARRILSADDLATADSRAADPDRKPMRFFLAARSRFAEDALVRAVGAGIRHVVVLGAGLDTFAMRNPFREVAVFEVDHPATQAWKRERLAEAGIAVPETLHFVPVDFEKESLSGRLEQSGLATDVPAFFLWLGVVPYLTREAVFAVLRLVAGRRNSEIVFDYGVPAEDHPQEARKRLEAFASRVAQLGEPLLTFFAPQEIHNRLRALGFSGIEDLGFADLAARYFPDDPVRTQTRGGHLIRARTG